MRLRILLFTVPLLVPVVLESVHSRTSSGSGRLPAIAITRIAALAPADAPPAAQPDSSPLAPPVPITNELHTDLGPHRADTRDADHRYGILLHHSAWFRGLRETKECDAIDGSELKQSCRDSFGALQALPRDKIRAMLAAR